MNKEYALLTLSVVLLAGLVLILLWSVGFAVYLNRIHSHGRASTRRLLRTLVVAAPLSLLLAAVFAEGFLVPTWVLARMGRQSCQLQMARRYATGTGLLARDFGTARWWLDRAARFGSGQAQLALAEMDLDGRGIPKSDPISALGWARLAAAQGLTPGRLVAAEILLQMPALAAPGETAQAYFAAALPQLMDLAASGSPQALFSVGMLKIRGHGVPMDQEGGLTMLLQAEDRGIEPFQQFTLLMLRSSLPADLVQKVDNQRAKQARAPGSGSKR